MQISSKEIYSIIGLSSLVFLIAPIFVILYVLSYNKKKRKNEKEKLLMRQTFENEILHTRIEVQEQTLKTVSYDLHDNIGQFLSLIPLTISSIDQSKVGAYAEKINTIDDIARRAINEIKLLARLLHGEDLLEKGLVPAIEAELAWLNRAAKYEVSFENESYGAKEPDLARDTFLFRSFQEGINNIIQHAKATRIEIELRQEDAKMTLMISDNGIGFPVAETSAKRSGMGIGNILRRAKMIDGQATISSAPGTGTQIKITIPK